MTKGKETTPQKTYGDDYYEKVREILTVVSTGEDSEALNQAENLLRTYPERAEAYFLLGLTAFKMDDKGGAADLFDKAHEIDPDCREYADALAIVSTLIGKLADGLYFAKLSTTMDPHPKIQPLLPLELSNYFQALGQASPSRHHIEAMRLYNLRDFFKAAGECQRELRINENNGHCMDLLGLCHFELGDFGQARDAHRAATELEPQNAKYRLHLGNALYRLGLFADALSMHREALDLDKDSLDVAIGAVSGAAYLDEESEGESTAIREDLERRAAALPEPFFGKSELRPKAEMIHVGFLCNSFHGGEVATFIEPFLRHYNRMHFETFCYQQSIVEDPINVQLKNYSDSWRKIYDLGDDVLASIIQGDEIDILFDLCGYSENGRHALIASKPAPIQIGWHPYPHGFGSAGIDFVLSDPITEETDKGLLEGGQQLLVLENGLAALEPFSIMPDVNDVPALEYGHMTFGGRSDLACLSPRTASMWAGTLKAVPGSWLLLGNVRHLCPAARNQAVELFANHGIVNRVKFWEDEDEHRANPEFYKHIDVLLDTTPVCGTVNLCEALWMGVPVLSLKGGRRTAQFGASILQAAGKPEWICETPDQMAEKAASLAGDLDKLGEIRSSLRGQVQGSALFNPKAYALAMEKALIQALEMKRGGG